MSIMKLHVWTNSDGLYLSRPPKPSSLTEVEFDPDVTCRQCGERVLSISADLTDICPWCESSMNRPKMLRYQELDIVRLLKKQSHENKDLESPTMPIIANKCTEKDLRDHLTEIGYFGRSAKFLNLELKAIERPGWVQVFKFQVQAKHKNGDWEEHFGICRSDERSNTFEVQLFGGQDVQDTAFRHKSKDMITHDRSPRHWSFWPLMSLFSLAIGTAVAGAIVSSLAGTFQ